MNLKIDLDITNPEYIGIAALSVCVLVLSHSTFIKNYLFKTEKSKINDAMKKKWNLVTTDSISDISNLGDIWEKENRNEDSASEAMYSSGSEYEDDVYISDGYDTEGQEFKKLGSECMIQSDEEWESKKVKKVKEEEGCLQLIKENKPIKVYEYVKGYGTTVAVHGTTKKERHWVYSTLGSKIHTKSIKGNDKKKVLLLTDMGLLNGLESKPLTFESEDVIAYDVDNEKAVLSRREVSQYEC
tara:strand:+ start:626 stop:1351 length:726 start_codon:yes stop_codon:yes gene_type:complete